MKITSHLLILSALFLQVPSMAEDSNPKLEIKAILSKDGSYEYNLVGKRLLRPVDEALLKRLVAHPVETSEHDFALSAWLLQIAAKADRKYLWILDSNELRKGDDPGGEEIINILLAYDFNVNGNKKALETLLDRVRKAMKKSRSWDVTHALASVNEWVLCRQALGSIRLGTDGAGGDERYGFWLTRRYFFPNDKSFPEDFATFCRDLDQLQGKAEQIAAGQPAISPESEPEGDQKPQSELEGRSR